LHRYIKELARALHPDKCRAPGAKDAFQKLLRAYQNVTAAQQ
jgi:curved DNA-binding protein CbpA